jgi:hypothetical protein
MLLESKGFQALGEMINSQFKEKHMAVDSYQLKSAIHYYAPDMQVAQWPGITRGSEFTRGFIDDRLVEDHLLVSESFAILAMNPYPQVIEGFEAIKFEGIRVCPDGSIGTFSVQKPILPCERGLREWWLTRYRKLNQEQF